MPLLHKQKFNRKTIPPNLDPNEEIFFCKLTQEIFLDYEYEKVFKNYFSSLFIFTVFFV